MEGNSTEIARQIRTFSCQKLEAQLTRKRVWSIVCRVYGGVSQRGNAVTIRGYLLSKISIRKDSIPFELSGGSLTKTATGV